MKLLILTQYFPPEVGAPQNRLYELAVRLKALGIDVSVLTAMPNYPQMQIHEEYKGRFVAFEEMNGLKVYRASIFVKKTKSIFFRLLNYFSFVFSSFWSGVWRVGKVDVILCESPPLFLGISAFGLKKIKGAKLIFNVSDLWPESAEKLGLVTNKYFLAAATRLEEFMYKKSELITGQTQGIVKNIVSRFPHKQVYWLPNGVDLGFYDSTHVSTVWRKENGFSETDFILLYAGVIGHAQGLEVILKAAGRLRENKSIKFILLGSGPEKEGLLELKRKLNLEQVYFYDAVAKQYMPAIVKASDAALVPLKRLDLFKGAIPSKIFENLAMKKPLVLGVEGEAKELFIDKGRAGVSFTPEDDKDLAEKILQLYSNKDLVNEYAESGYRYVKDNFSRDKIASEFLQVLSSLK